ncbi:hypothetical protein AJ80_00722 [Polytolypa hystricis UAMH7299]|uniref:ATP-grasp domain-containing protein n=1 Tax=Polytolypa hystricis (strain UAMH7299) TaxID=1447883 RepID=A0A2B7Z348_POLH7|nr:hypothetical protein AJ80_00722 [Polytolypa hystricis UAMH7299]
MKDQTAVTSPEMCWTFSLRSSTTIVSLRALGKTVTKKSTQHEQKHWCLDLEVILQESATESVADSFAINVDHDELDSVYAELFKALLKDVSVASSSKDGRRTTILRLVFSRESGTVVRSDFLSYRLHDCEGVSLAVDFLKPLSSVHQVAPEEAVNIRTTHSFLELLGSAVGGIVAHATVAEEDTAALCRHLDDEFTKRLSFPWVTNEPLTRSRVFWIQGRANIEASQQFYEAASALGITLVVLDEPGHWLEDDAGPHAHYREAFIPISIDGDEGLTQRVVDAVRSYPHKVDGIVSISDVRLPRIARACEILGLPTSSSAAYALAGDKGATRELESAAAGGDEGFVLETPDQLDAALIEKKDRLRYPLIVKPCTGWNSDCVVKVRNEAELYAAVQRASARHVTSAKSDTRVVVEPYIDGPEIDANFIVLDGEVLFCDISDDFPCSGDLPGSEGVRGANFMETLMDVPSALPANEKDIMRESLRKCIARLGFQSGVFHCEARVRGSRARYEPCSDNGILDLHVQESKSRTEEEEAPSCYLHEVNARPPGYINCVAALLAYGVDYYAIRLLLSLGTRENARVKALAQPFLGGKPQYVLGVCVLPPTRAGIMASDDAVLEFLEANPELRTHVVHYQTIKKKGDVVQGPDSSELWCVAYVTVASRKSRKECLELVQQVRKKFDYRLV